MQFGVRLCGGGANAKHSAHLFRVTFSKFAESIGQKTNEIFAIDPVDGEWEV